MFRDNIALSTGIRGQHWMKAFTFLHCLWSSYKQREGNWGWGFSEEGDETGREAARDEEEVTSWANKGAVAGGGGGE